LTAAAPDAPLVLDLQAAQSPTYRERGVARYALDFTVALVRTAPELVDQVLVRPDLAPLSGLAEALGPDRVTTRADWSRPGGVFHALSPFDIGTPVRELWPREASRAGRRLVVTVYDLIPELFPDTYLVDPGTRHRYRARRELIRAADHVVTLSRSAADDVADHLGVPDHRLTVVGAACSDVFRPGASPAEETTLARALLPGLGERTVVYNGAVEPRKNMEGLIRAFAGLPDEVRHRHQLVLVCRLQPLERNHYEVLGRSLGLDPGELLLTGLVSDEALVHLYRSAALVVYPSRYEGYGLPVAEAMACGAPVVASGNSSLRELVDAEATFDPDDLVGMTAAIERGLVDRAFRDRLLRWSARPRPTWSAVAERAAAVYRQLSTEPGSDRPRRPADWPRRPRIALVTPWPPATTGVASYSRRLARALRDSVDVELFVDGDDADRALADPEFPSYPARALPRVDPVLGGYEAVIACVGNSQHHAGALALVRRDGVHAAVLAHDVRLNGLYRHGAARGAVPEGNTAVVTGLYEEATEEWVTDGWLQPAQAEEHGVFLARELIGLAEPFIVTSEYAAELARLDARAGDRGRVVVCPYAYPAPVPRPPGREQPGLVATFGLVNAVKQPELLLSAFALVHRSEPAARLAFVGPIDPALLERYHALAVRLGVADAVTFTGEVDDHGYEEWLGRTSVAVQLRATTNGETSGAVADCLSHGVVTVVTDLGPARQLPDLVAKVPGSATPATLADLVGSLLADPGQRATREAEGLAFVAGMGFDRGARDLLAAVGLAPVTVDRPDGR
jgi:glycosyltransferase involved in cell wall biosynthesis